MPYPYDDYIQSAATSANSASASAQLAVSFANTMSRAAKTVDDRAIVVEALVNKPLYANVSVGVANTVAGSTFAVNANGVVTLYTRTANSATAEYTLSTTTLLTSANGAASIGVIGGGSVQSELNGKATSAQGAKADTALQKADNYVTRAGNYLGIGQQTDFDTFGKGGILLGGGHNNRGDGAYITLDGLRNWVTIQTSRADNPTELIVYGSSAQGYAQCVAGGGNIDRLYGSAFRADMVGKAFYFLRKKFRVGAFVSADRITLTETNGAAVSFPSAEIEAWNYAFTTGSGTCSVSGNTVTWISGDPLPAGFFQDFEFILNGTTRTVSEFTSPLSIKLSTSPGNTSSTTFEWRGNIFDQLSTLRVQAIQGGNEENVNLYTVAGQEFYGRYHALRAGVAGTYGQARPIYIGSGFYGPYQPRDQIGVYPNGGPSGSYGNGYVTLGGVQGLESLRVYNPTNVTDTNKNMLEIPHANTGISPSIRAAGVDTNIDITFTPKGTGTVRFGVWTSNADTAVNGYVTVKDAAGNVRKLATIA